MSAEIQSFPSKNRTVISRFFQVLICALALGAIILSLWSVTHRSSLLPPNVARFHSSYLFIFADDMLGAVSGLFPVAVWIYAFAITTASLLAMALIVSSARIPSALWLGGALSGLALSAAHFVFVYHIPQLATTPLLAWGDYVAITLFVFGSWAGLQAALNYPQTIDVDAFMAHQHKELQRARASLLEPKSPLGRLRKRLYTATGGREQQGPSKTDFFQVSMGRGMLKVVRSHWWPCGLMVLGWIFVSLWHRLTPGAELAAVLLVIPFWSVPPTAMAVGAYQVLDWQYRTGREEDKRRIAWLVVGLAIALGLPVISVIVAMALTVCGKTAWGGNLLVSVMALSVPVIATVFVVLLGISIFFFGAFDPKMALRKTSVYGIAALLLSVALAAAQSSVVSQIVGKLSLPAQSGSVLAGAMVALVFAPMRKTIENCVERVVDRVLPASTLAEAHRETVTVVFGDLSGYTELSAKDEASALTLASLLHKESRRLAEKSGGRLVKTIGDAVLLSFREPSEAAVACVELREKFAAATTILNLPLLPLHFGLHTGEVVRDKDGDIFGATVNLAARLQGLAKANEVVISEAVAQTLPDGLFRLEAMGPQKLKNVPMPVTCFRAALV